MSEADLPRWREDVVGIEVVGGWREDLYGAPGNVEVGARARKGPWAVEVRGHARLYLGFEDPGHLLSEFAFATERNQEVWRDDLAGVAVLAAWAPSEGPIGPLVVAGPAIEAMTTWTYDADVPPRSFVAGVGVVGVGVEAREGRVGGRVVLADAIGWMADYTPDGERHAMRVTHEVRASFDVVLRVR